MYSFIEGKIADLNPTTAVIACQGIGYSINISLNTYTQIQGKESCRLHTHLVVREDAQHGRVGHRVHGFALRQQHEQLRHLVRCRDAQSVLG